MTKKSEISLTKRIEIQFLFDSGMTQSAIAKKIKCSRCAVQSALDRYRKTGTHLNRERTGRKKLTTHREDRFLIRTSIKNRKKRQINWLQI